MENKASGFYHDPPLWVGDAPTDLDMSSPLTLKSFNDTIFRRQITNQIELKVTREGIFAFSFEGWEQGQHPTHDDAGQDYFAELASAVLNRTLVMNTFLALLYSNEISTCQFERNRMVVTPELVISMNEGLDKVAMGFGNQRVSHLASSRFPNTYAAGIPPIFDNRLITRGPIIPREVVEKSAAALTEFLHPKRMDALLLADLFLRASKSYQDHNYSAALITNWAIAEKLLHELWGKYQENNRVRDKQQFITKKRKEILGDGRTFTASVIVEVLSFVGDIELDLYEKISRVRKARNNWIHSLLPISINDAVDSTQICEQLLKIVRRISLVGARGLNIHN